MSTLFRPSPSERKAWIDATCGPCRKTKHCVIPDRAEVHLTTHPNYPKQWVYDEGGTPVCTRFAPKVSNG